MRSSGPWVQGTGSFLTRETGVMLAAGALALVTFGSFAVHGDGNYYYLFLRRLLGVDEPLAVAYQFGTALWNLPFYVTGAAVDHREVGIGIASAVALGLTLYLVWRLLGLLQLPRGIVVLGAAVLGTPLWFYVVYEPSYTHAVDALAFSATAVALALAAERGGDRWPLVLGACLGVLPLVRYANLALVPVLLVGLALLRGRRAAAVAALAALVVGLALVAVPLGAGMEYRDPPPAVNGPTAPPDFDPLAPVKMLFSLRRGLLLWTPLTALAVAGVVLHLRRAAGHRAVVGTLAVGALAVLLVHVMWGRAWDAGFSFSQRFLASFVPLYALGVAELIRRFRAPALAAATVAVAFSLFVGATLHVGYEGQQETDGIDDVLGTYVDGRRNLEQLARALGDDARDRWAELTP